MFYFNNINICVYGRDIIDCFGYDCLVSVLMSLLSSHHYCNLPVPHLYRLVVLDCFSSRVGLLFWFIVSCACCYCFVLLLFCECYVNAAVVLFILRFLRLFS